MECGMLANSVKIYQRLVVYVYVQMKVHCTMPEYARFYCIMIWSSVFTTGFSGTRVNSLRETLSKWQAWDDLQWLANHHIVRKTLWDMLDVGGTMIMTVISRVFSTSTWMSSKKES
ncbi:hypothetical protein BD410DRAFT_126393 [Rickenella mellea]|uniref:Uncharacterized protein n=1 Tax=Rickenella mellea TaxID=50990 RepID=A0A4Y7Q9I8_9AGAM|nr:hypothetical protein BD410DRAFT_126393 [Rickenella mellea]